MINWKILLLVIIFTIIWDIGGDYLHSLGLVKSVYIGNFHLQHEYMYLLMPIFLILSFLKKNR